MVRLLAIPIIVFWALLAVVTNTFVPKIEDVAQELAGPMVPTYAPSQVAMLTIGKEFHESTSTSLTMLVLEADRGLTEQDRDYYAGLVRTLKADSTHVQYVMDTWGKPITAAGAQSLDGKSAYVLLRLAGDIGQMEANNSVDAVRKIVNISNPPAGLKVYVSGAAPLAADTVQIANSSLNNITIATMFLIIFMLLLVYRSVVTMLVPFFGVILLMLSVKGVISAFGHYGFIPLSSFATKCEGETDCRHSTSAADALPDIMLNACLRPSHVPRSKSRVDAAPFTVSSCFILKTAVDQVGPKFRQLSISYGETVNHVGPPRLHFRARTVEIRYVNRTILLRS